MRITSFLSVLFAAPFLLLPSLAMGQGYEVTFMVHMVKDPKAKYGSGATIWTANCAKLDVKLAKQSVSCTLEQNTCTDKCTFTQQSTDLPPRAPVFGWSMTNPTCAWVFDPWAQRYVFRCW